MSSLNAQTYDPEKVKVMIGTVPIVGFADGTFIKISKNKETFTQHVGAHGDVDYTKSADNTGKVSLTLKHTSPSNWILRRLETEGKNNKFFSVVVIDANVSDIALDTMYGCVVEKTPDNERGADVTSREWTILFADRLDASTGLLSGTPAFDLVEFTNEQFKSGSFR